MVIPRRAAAGIRRREAATVVGLRELIVVHRSPARPVITHVTLGLSPRTVASVADPEVSVGGSLRHTAAAIGQRAPRVDRRRLGRRGREHDSRCSESCMIKDLAERRIFFLRTLQPPFTSTSASAE